MNEYTHTHTHTHTAHTHTPIHTHAHTHARWTAHEGQQPGVNSELCVDEHMPAPTYE